MSTETAADSAPPADPQRLKFLMRSGNDFMIDGVLEFELERSPVTDRVVRVKMVQLTNPKYARLMVETLDIAQIEAVLILPPNGPGRRANEKERDGEH